MIYLHELKALNPKSAAIESVPIIREIKEKSRLPLSEEHMLNDFIRFLVKDSDIKAMESVVEIIPQAMQEVLDFSRLSQNAEQINLKRAHTELQEIHDHLKANIGYAKQIFAWQFPAIPQMAELINKIPSLKTKEERMAFNEEISPLFEIMLRNKKFAFLFWDIISEAQVERIKGIIQGMEEGIFFHTDIGDYLKKASFNEIRKKLPPQELIIFDRISAKMPEIKKGVDTAYDMNKRMVGFAVQFFSYLKWLGGV